MRGDRYTLRNGVLVYLHRERRCTSRKIRMGFKRTMRRIKSGEFFREAQSRNKTEAV